MNYADAESLWCKITASNDFISQAACWVNFEAKYPPGSQQFAQMGNDLQSLAVIIFVVMGFVVIQLRPNRGRQLPRRWIDRF